MDLSHRRFGKDADGRDVDLFSILNGNGIAVQVLSLGATLSSVVTPDAHDQREEITLGFDSIDGYLARHPYFGSTVGRFANRIARGHFVLDGVDYQLACNDGSNHLHGGSRGFDHVLWDPSPFSSTASAGVRLTYRSKDGEEGYPGTLEASVSYTLDEQDVLHIDYDAVTDRPTPLNLSNHAYWNLRGAGSGPILDHRMTLYADHYLPVDSGLIPTGELAKVEGTSFDFRSEKTIGTEADGADGYDHCFVIRKRSSGLRKAARVYEPTTGRGFEIQTTQPGVQFYTGNKLQDMTGRAGKRFSKHGAFCLETQGFPDAVNQPKFPSAILRPGERYQHSTRIHFFCQ